ncbi:MAG TPA: PAN domain-containing protein [Oligoflexus sp.]|uniref:PAN domain-containing protein n=1 Tax=Oligoflexus sp. TaxID=1971216 RepID=UPI002D41B0F4|nr:PAN domain-containing protein [Oligoflexus sp.]HYX31471.1 PAN domain-containing protein [Oligoflexus sp.]
MQRILALFIMSALFITTLGQAEGTNWDFKENCDVPSESFQTLKSVSQEECQRTCDNEKNCKGFVYITGWKRCLLKDQMQKQARLRFISGELDEKRGFEASRLKLDSDHSGKDLERKVLDQPEMCADACKGRADCQAFTFLEGYRVCWLKAAGGRLSEKIFHCGMKKT